MHEALHQSRVPCLVLAENWEVSKDGHLSASHPKEVSTECGDHLVEVPCNGRPSPQAGKFYWHKQAQSGMQSWVLAQPGTWGRVSVGLPALAHAPKVKNPASPAGRVVCAVQSVGLI